MAKKRKKTDAEKEEKEYRPPEFDEREFITEEINIARAVILGGIISLPTGIAAFFVSEALGTSFGGLVVVILGIVLIKHLMPVFKVDEVLFKPKHWLSVASTYFFALLAIWVLIMNPPFNDFAGPQIMNLDLEIVGPVNQPNMTANSTFVEIIDNGTVKTSQVNVTAGLEMAIHAEIADNSGEPVSSVLVNGQTVAPANNMFTFTMPANTTLPTRVNITAYDSGNNFSIFEFTIAGD